MTGFHIGKKVLSAQCRAKPGNCPLKNSDRTSSPHFETREKMDNFIDYSNQMIHEGTFPSKINVNDLSSNEIKQYIEFNENFIKNQKYLLEDSYLLTENKKKSLEKKFDNNLSPEDKEILEITKQAIEKGYINNKSGKYISYPNTTTPLAYLENVEGPIKIVAQHSLVNKFGKLKGFPVTSKTFSRKNLEWINDYKNNPELLEKDFNTIKNNIESFSKIYNKEGKLKKDSIQYDKLKEVYDNLDNNAIAENNRSKTKLLELQELNDKLEEEYKLHQYIEKFIPNAKINQRKNSIDLPITEAYPISSKETSEPFEIQNLSVDKNNNIENLFLYNNENKRLTKIIKIKDSKSQNLIDENGNSFNFETRYARRTHGRWAIGKDKTSPYELITSTSSKKSTPYKGENKIFHTYVISTD